MKEDFSELVQYLDGKFESIDARLIGLGGKIDNLQENKANKKDVNNLLGAIDTYAQKADTFFQEMVE